MRKILLTLLLAAVLATPAMADDVSIQWIPVEDQHCAGYIVQTSIDLGKTWADAAETGDPKMSSILVTGLPSDAMVFFRVVALNANGDRFPRTWSGAWYDGRLRPISDPAGAGIK